jgi:hypothetical protein
MPRILITTEPADNPDAVVMLSERIATSDLASEHFAAHLIQRLAWALADAENNEHRPIKLAPVRARWSSNHVHP